MKNGTWIYSIIFIVISGTFSDSCKKKEASLPEIITKEATLIYDDDRIIYVTGGTIVSDDGNPNGLDANTNCELSMPFFIIDNPVNNYFKYNVQSVRHKLS
jgi:hypothetical protein